MLLCVLAGHGNFLLIAGEDDESWCQAATQIAQELKVPLKAIRISPFAGDRLDLRFDWLHYRGISPTGAILVRPDRFVAWRSYEKSTDPRVTLENVLQQVLGTRQAATR